MDEKVKLSVVVITKNEEKRIGDCLESVKWADEIIVLDDLSADKTVEAARKYTDKVYQRAWTNEGDHRNYAYSLAGNEWVLSLDADERVTPELRDEIFSVLSKGTDKNGFAIPRKNYIGDFWLRHGGWYPSAQLRLFRKNEFKYEEVDVHPRAFMKDPRGELKSPMIHYSYRDIEDFVYKLDNQTDRECAKWGDDPKHMPFSRAIRRSIDRFSRAYNRKNGKKDGMYGFIMAVFGGSYQFLSYAKFWEKRLKFTLPYDTKKEGPSGPLERTPDGGRKKLSVVVLTKNEEGKIGHCLDSVRWADEIVLIDGFSTDRTAEIAERFGAKVVRHKFEGDFGQERNLGAANSSGDWVLELDADEIVTPALRRRIEAILKDDGGFASFKFRRKNFFLGRFMKRGGWYHYSHHFFKKGFARYSGRVHETLFVDGKTGLIEEEIEHYPFSNISQLVRRHNKYTTLEALQLFESAGKAAGKEYDYNIRTRPMKLFWKIYVRKMGFMEGMHGFVFSVLFPWIHFLRWAKYWEKSEHEPM